VALRACFRRVCLLSIPLLSLVCAAAVWGAVPSEQLLPATTKGYLSTTDVDEVREKFQATTLGKLVNDPIMQPFIDDLKEQINTKLDKVGKQLGVKWDDLEGVYGGEVALARIQPDAKDRNSHATVLLVDITGKRDKADALLAKVDANQKARGAARSQITAGGVAMVVYTQPLEAGKKVPAKAYYFIKDEMLVASDHLDVATAIAGRFDGNAKDSLATLAAYQATMKRVGDAAGGAKHQIRWFVEPFGYAEVSRAVSGLRRKRGNDMVKILREQGYSAIQGLGGEIYFATGQEEVLHRTLVYAPAVAGKAGERAKDKYDLAMRMLDFPNAANPADLDPQPWAMHDVASYLTFNWKLKDAFEFSRTLVDAIAGDKGVFDDIWLSLETDPNGPRINIRKELVDHLGERVTVLSDVKTPVDLKSERLMLLVEVKKPDVVAAVLEKAFKDDPAAKKRMTKDGHTIWELTQEEGIAAADTTSTDFQIEGAGFVSKDDKDAEEEEEVVEDPALPNMAMTVFQGHLIVSTHVDYIVEFLEGFGKGEKLDARAEYKQVDAARKRLGSANDSFRFYTRTEEAYRGTYELIKQNKLPESEMMIARFLNAVFKPQEEGALRNQAIDGSKLPAFEEVMRYFGPGGFFVQTERDGWFVVGCLLKK
jgi:hypothetical protein